jgi:hopanoid biosynthesis associated protein HpnK
MARVIVNGDDFGRSSAINAAIVQGHREGILTSASLMIGAPAADEAIALAKKLPSLAVGLHVVCVAGKAVLPHDRIPTITDGAGWFPSSGARGGWRYFRDPRARAQLAVELRAQFERFADSGLPLSHVDGHLHMHVHPIVFTLLTPLLQHFGARGFRLPRDDVSLALAHERADATARVTRATTFGMLSRWCLARMRGSRLSVVERCYGLLQSGRMHESYLTRVLHSLRVETAEVYLHPSTRFEGDPLGPNPQDLEAVVSPAVREALRKSGHELATYSSLHRAVAA